MWSFTPWDFSKSEKERMWHILVFPARVIPNTHVQPQRNSQSSASFGTPFPLFLDMGSVILLHQQYWLCPQGSLKMLQLTLFSPSKETSTFKSLTEYSFLAQYLFQILVFKTFPHITKCSALWKQRLMCGSGVLVGQASELKARTFHLRDLSLLMQAESLPLLLPPQIPPPVQGHHVSEKEERQG